MKIEKKNSTKILTAHQKLPFEDLFDCIPNSVLIFDENMNVMFMNSHFKKLRDSFTNSYQEAFIQKITAAVQVPTVRTSRRASPASKNVLRPPSNLIRIQHNEKKYIHVSVFHSHTTENEKNYIIVSLINQTDSVEKEEELRRLSQIDSLTGIYNRYAISQKINTELKHFARQNVPSCILYLDLDHFKKVNDTYGHSIGDLVLQSFSALISKRIRAFDSFGRLGGEEFCILLLNTSLDSALKVANDILARIRKTPLITTVDGEKKVIPYSCSIGIAPIRKDLQKIDEWLRRADKALYVAKYSGRDKACVYKENNISVDDDPDALMSRGRGVRKTSR